MKIREIVNRNITLRITYSAMMIAFVFLTTIVFSLYIPATKGFFNIGEAGVYIAALTGGTFIGAVAGGFGSMFADLYLNYPYYAPGTLVIKGLEGLIVGYLGAKLEGKFQGKMRRIFGMFVGTLIGLGIMLLGNVFYLGEAEISISGLKNPITVNISSLIWYILGGLLIILVLILGYKYPEDIGYILAMVAGGSEMIVGYFLYESIVLGVAAYVEILYNAMQMIIGTLIALMVVGGIKRTFYE